MAAFERLALAPLLAAACVFPASDPTGIEFSWRFLEANTADGDDAQRVRSCGSAEVERVAVDITDEGDETRQGIFRFPCAAGYQTQTEFQTEASDAFVQLDPGSYTVKMSAIDPGGLPAEAELLETRTIDVADRNITTEPWDLRRAPVDLMLQVTGAETCDQVRMTLLYDDPAKQLPELAIEGGDEDEAVIYRRSLGSSLGVLLDGTPASCGEALNGAHVFSEVDRGDYLLEIAVDGFACAIRVTVGATPSTIPVDLTALPCGG